MPRKAIVSPAAAISQINNTIFILVIDYFELFPFSSAIYDSAILAIIMRADTIDMIFAVPIIIESQEFFIFMHAVRGGYYTAASTPKEHRSRIRHKQTRRMVIAAQ